MILTPGNLGTRATYWLQGRPWPPPIGEAIAAPDANQLFGRRIFLMNARTAITAAALAASLAGALATAAKALGE